MTQTQKNDILKIMNGFWVWLRDLLFNPKTSELIGGTFIVAISIICVCDAFSDVSKLGAYGLIGFLGIPIGLLLIFHANYWGEFRSKRR